MNTWWIEEPDILASSCPNDDTLRKLYRENFRIVVSLLYESEQPPLYDPATASTLGYRRYNIPLSECGFPTTQQIETFLRLIKDRQSHEKVIVHCMHGQKRTKNMAMAYLLSQGLSEETIKNGFLPIPNNALLTMLSPGRRWLMKMTEVKEIAKKWGVNTRVGRTKRDLIQDIQVKEGFTPCYGTRDICDESECLWRKDCIPQPRK